MDSHAKRLVLKRVERLYTMVEEMHSIALRQASALVREAELAIDEQCVQMNEARRGAREAMLRGDCEWRAVAEAHQELGQRSHQLLTTIRLERDTVRVSAQEEYRANLMKSEQMKSVVEAGAAAEERVAERRTQAASDDRFLSRLRWNQLGYEGA